MEKLTTGQPIIEQDRGRGILTLALPKKFITSRGLVASDTIYVTNKIDCGTLVIEVSEYYRDGAITRTVTSSAGYCRFTIPRAIKNHKKGSRWEAYTDGKGLLRYEYIDAK